MATFLTSRPGSAADPSLPHLVLVGLAGAGKTTVGQLLAQALERSFLDFDVEITRRCGMSVPEIFGQRGEPWFREQETALTRDLAETGGMVLSPGGGWILGDENRALLCPRARLIYLKVSPEVALHRMGAATANRPLLNRPDPRGELEKLLEARRPLYELAELVVSVDRLDAQRVTERILEKLQPA
ncbi:MAG TPA: shikimate kinase [Gemmatimonadaceae bacterium]|nr:shikimate kinase [Gemmatimonadaceae bacterium]